LRLEILDPRHTTGSTRWITVVCIISLTDKLDVIVKTLPSSFFSSH
jgi:hypothetical protein